MPSRWSSHAVIRTVYYSSRPDFKRRTPPSPYSPSKSILRIVRIPYALKYEKRKKKKRQKKKKRREKKDGGRRIVAQSPELQEDASSN